MDNEQSNSWSGSQLRELATALEKMRDSFVEISGALGDLLVKIPSPHRDEVLTEVERYLCRLREVDRRSSG